MEVFRFENQSFYLLFSIIPVLVLIYSFSSYSKKKKLNKFASKLVFSKITSGISKYKSFSKFLLVIIAISSLILAIMNPQIGSKLEEVKREGIEIMIAIDVSNSMLAEDIKPNRLESAKQAINNLINKLYNDKIGIILFAGDSFLQLPLTTDYSAAKLLLSTVSTELIPTQGTAIGSAIQLAMDSFTEESKTGKALIIITDGENHEDDALTIAKEANEKGITITTIGMGTEEGAPIPLFRNGQRYDFIKDREGNTVVTKLDAAMLSQIASSANGGFLRASNAGVDLKEIIDEMQDLEKETFESKVFTDYEDRFQIFLAICLFLLVIEFFISNRENNFLKKVFSFGDAK
jgi:Ca-activated chloride channel family protein